VEEDEITMTKENYVPDPLAVLAQEAAHKVGCQARRWWRDAYNPRRLYIEVNYTPSTGQPFPVWISTLIPGQLAHGHHVEPQAEQRADASGPVLTKTPRERGDLLTPAPRPAQTPQRLSHS